jgi:membrane associated rhomboid family serine protease
MFNNIPVVTKNLIIINVLVFFVVLIGVNMGNDTLPFYLSAHYFNVPSFEPYQLVTHMFMHDLNDFSHLFFNMLLLLLLGMHLERFLGAKRFFIFYIACGIGALIVFNFIGIIQVYQIKQALIADGYNIDVVNEFFWGGNIKELYIHSSISNELLSDYGLLIRSSMLGASGAVFGLMAAFFLLFPNTEIMLLFIPVPVKVKYLIGIYLAVAAYKAMTMPNDTVAHMAHVGGALVGFVIILYWRKTDRKNFY